MKIQISTALKSAALLLILIAAGCSTTPTQTAGCQELDWYEIGRADGARGLADNKQRQVKVVCEDSDESLSEALYQNGFDSGIAQFCNPQIGFEQGRLHQKSSASICPPLLRSDYRAAFERGTHYADLQSNQLSLTRKIATLVDTIGKANDASMRQSLTQEKIQLEQQKRAVDQEISGVENDKSIYVK